MLNSDSRDMQARLTLYKQGAVPAVVRVDWLTGTPFILFCIKER